MWARRSPCGGECSRISRIGTSATMPTASAPWSRRSPTWIPADRERAGGPGPGEQPHQGATATLQHRAPRRQTLSLHPLEHSGSVPGPPGGPAHPTGRRTLLRAVRTCRVMWNLLALIHRTFPLRTCRKHRRRTRCLEYHLGRCLAPCEGLVTPQEYREMVQEVRLLLEERPGGHPAARTPDAPGGGPPGVRARRAIPGPDRLAPAGCRGSAGHLARGEDQDVFGWRGGS